MVCLNKIRLVSLLSLLFAVACSASNGEEASKAIAKENFFILNPHMQRVEQACNARELAININRLYKQNPHYDFFALKFYGELFAKGFFKSRVPSKTGSVYLLPGITLDFPAHQGRGITDALLLAQGGRALPFEALQLFTSPAKKRPLLVAGHSMGGMVAQLIDADNTVSFGSPIVTNLSKEEVSIRSELAPHRINFREPRDMIASANFFSPQNYMRSRPNRVYPFPSNVQNVTIDALPSIIVDDPLALDGFRDHAGYFENNQLSEYDVIGNKIINGMPSFCLRALSIPEVFGSYKI